MEFATRRGAVIELRAVEEVLDPPGLFQTINKPMVRRVVVDALGQKWIVTQLGVPFLDSYRVVQTHARPLEIRPGDYGDFRGKIIEAQQSGYIVEFNGPRGPQRLWLCEADMTCLQEIPDPEPLDTAADEAPGGAKARGVAAAIAALWPEGIPAGLSGKDRDNEVRQWLTDHKLSVPTNVQRAVQRALAEACV